MSVALRADFPLDPRPRPREVLDFLRILVTSGEGARPVLAEADIGAWDRLGPGAPLPGRSVLVVPLRGGRRRARTRVGGLTAADRRAMTRSAGRSVVLARGPRVFGAEVVRSRGDGGSPQHAQGPSWEPHSSASAPLLPAVTKQRQTDSPRGAASEGPQPVRGAIRRRGGYSVGSSGIRSRSSVAVVP